MQKKKTQIISHLTTLNIYFFNIFSIIYYHFFFSYSLKRILKLINKRRYCKVIFLFHSKLLFFLNLCEIFKISYIFSHIEYICKNEKIINKIKYSYIKLDAGNKRQAVFLTHVAYCLPVKYVWASFFIKTRVNKWIMTVDKCIF